jgi:DNA-binding transcriptional LysR family regulator
MELRHLRYFQAVAEELSYSKAARRLCIAQPALSRAVQEMESELGALLFDRGGRAIRLTPAGDVLLRDTALLFERLDEMVRRVRRTAAGEEGELRLGYIGPPTRGFLGPLLKTYRKRHPKVTVVLEERTPERVAEMVSKGRLSIGLTRPVLAADSLGLKSLTLWEEPFAALVAADHPFAGTGSLAWQDLADQPLILLARREGAGSHDTILAACEEAGFSPKIVHSPSVIGTVLQYVEAGAGIGVVPASVLPQSPSVHLLPLEPVRGVPLVMVWAEEGNDPAVTAFRDLVSQWLSQGLLQGKG